MPVLFGASSVGLTSDPSACSIMSRRAAPPDSPWQNGMPPFGLCQQQFNPMMNCGPMWAQPGLPFVGSMAPDMMRFGGNVSARSNFRRNYDQPDRYSRPRQPYGDRGGNRPSPYARGDRKRPAPGHRSRSPAGKKAKRPEGGRKPEQGKPKGAEGAGEAEEQDGAGTAAELYDPAEPTSEDAGDGVEQAEGNEGDESGAAMQEETTEGGEGEAKGDAENGESAPQDENGDTAEGKSSPSKPGGKPGAKPGGGAAKQGGRPTDKKADGAARSDKEQGTVTIGTCWWNFAAKA
ncbi:hypothetical protein HPB48_005065 [Haemaphysalis longicornis]|uniref:Uncharacterized protein n=1 Tax=Haemaphysalis longicornis TaxID=44386 RepID=A0A9J6F7D0_HAELO|nr:hypothetical protein HPB48_005065 [Haemaphysalis longicornis]